MLFYEVKAYKIKQLTLLKVHWYMWDTLHKEILNDSWKQIYSLFEQYLQSSNSKSIRIDIVNNYNKNIAKLVVKLYEVKSMPLEPK